MNPFSRWTAVCLAVAVVYATPVCAQSDQLAPAGALAWTQCLGGHVDTYVNAAFIGSDTLAEVLVHEAKHVEQAKRAGPGKCPDYSRIWTLLTAEVEAYCASKPIRMKSLHQLEVEVDANYILRLLNQFGGALPRATIIQSYYTGCPGKTVHRWATR